MLDPGIKVEKGYEIYETGSEADVWVQAQNEKPYIGALLRWHDSSKLLYLCDDAIDTSCIKTLASGP